MTSGDDRGPDHSGVQMERNWPVVPQASHTWGPSSILLISPASATENLERSPRLSAWKNLSLSAVFTCRFENTLRALWHRKAERLMSALLQH